MNGKPKLGIFLPERPLDHLRLDVSSNAIGCLRAAILDPLLERLRAAQQVELIEGLDFRNALIRNGDVWCGDVRLNELDRFFWYCEIDRRPGSFDLEVLKTLSREVEVVRDPFAFEIALDKFEAHLRLRDAGVRVAESLLFDRRVAERIEMLLDEWGAALLKPRRGGWGRGVTLIDSVGTLRDILGYVRSTVGEASDGGFFLERFYDNDPQRWASITMIDSEIALAYRKTADRFTDLGNGRLKVEDLDERGGGVVMAELTPEHEQQARLACEALGLGLIGFDMIWTDEGPLVVDENTSPGNDAALYAGAGGDPAAQLAAWILKGL